MAATSDSTRPTGTSSLDVEEASIRLFPICGPCVRAEGSECHTPGCAFWLHDVPSEPLNEDLAATYEDEAPYETLQEVARLVDSCIPDRRDSYGFRHAMKAAVAMAERGLLATARPDTTATEVAATEAVEADCRICQGTGMATLNPDEEPGSHVCEPPRVQQP